MRAASYPETIDRARCATPEPGAAMADSGYDGILLDRLATQAAEILEAEQSCIFVRDHDDPTMTIIAAAHGPAEDSLGKRVDAFAEHSQGTRAPAAAVQLQWEGELHGALSVTSEVHPRRFSAGDLAVLRTLGVVAGAAVSHLQARKSPGTDVRGPIRDFTAALDRRDGYTARHSQDVVATACEIGTAFGLGQAELAELEVAALLHDIGKVWVPDEILKKPGPLTAEERAVISQHPIWGAAMLTRVPGLEAVATIVRYHHERWDGTGYPHGLSGSRIPLTSRIIAVCDAHNAMTSDRPYRNAIGRERALSELRHGAGRQFDPGVVTQFEAALPSSVAA
jgi:putative nucleotidyltransferase with HDIG domain